MMGRWRFGAATVVVAALLASDTALATVLYTYDDLGRVTSITYDDGKRVTYSYDPAGNRTQHVVDEVGNQPPVAVNDAIGIDLNVSPSAAAYVLTNDSDPNSDILIVQSVTTPSLGTAVIGGGGSYVTYTFTGSYALAPTTDSFNYTISDGRGGTATATVNVDIFIGELPCVPPPGQFECEIE
jgi:YD repeat-containing protein